MAQKAYGGISNIARNGIKLYGGVNNIARNVIKGYVGDENGIARQFWGNVKRFIYRLLYNQDYQVGTEYTFDTWDIIDVLKYVLDEFLHYNEDYWFNMHPDTIKYISDDYSNIISYVEANKGNYDVGYVEFATSGSGMTGSTIEITVWLGNISNTITPSDKLYAEGNYYYTIPNITFPYRIAQRYNASGLIGRNAQNQNRTANFLGERNAFSYTTFMAVVNMGINIQQVEKSEYEDDYMFYWDFTSQNPLVDKCRGKLVDCKNGIVTNNGISLTNGCLRIPDFSVYAGFFDIEIEAEFADLIPARNPNTGVLITSQLFHMEGYTYFCLNNNGIWGYYNNRGQGWQPTDVTEDYMPTNFHLKMSYDGFWSSNEFGSAEFALESNPGAVGNPIGQGYYSSFLGGYNGTSVGSAFASGIIKSLKIKWKPVDYTHIYFYGRFLFYKSPEGIDVGYNKIVGANYSDFIDYLGTDKTLVRTGSGTITYFPITEGRALNMIPRWHIRMTNNANDFVELFIPINHETGAAGKTLEMNAHCFSSGSADFEFGMAYINEDSLVIDNTQCVLYHTGIKKYFYTLVNDTMDYIYFKIPTQSSQKTVLVSLIKIY